MVPGDVPLGALRGGLAVEDHRAEADAAEQLAHLGGATRLRPALPLREVHAQEPARVAAGQVGGRARGLLRRLRRERRSRHTATGVSPGAFAGRPRMVTGTSARAVSEAINPAFPPTGPFPNSPS